MDLSADSGTPAPHTAVGGPVLEQELSLSSACCQTESGGTLLLQLLEFKAHLLEAVEELHIRKDAETRFEDQISKLVLEKQELEWEKESLQHRIETAANQHTESLTSVKQQFQAKIRNIEEEKGKYQVSAELKDKEINNLKEELRSLQLLKYNLEKKSNELEQKLALQSRSKDSHLNQLGEVEKRFSALSRQCAVVKQAHEKLEQNVDEAMRINDKLTSANEKQDATIVSLKKELEDVSNKLIKAKMASVRHDKTHSLTGPEQHIQTLHQKLNMETEMNKKVREENVSVRAEKQEVMRSLQHTQQLLLSQTHTVNRVELELQTQREQHQALKQEHEVMRDKSKAMEDKVAQLMESYNASKTSWDKEKQMFLNRVKSEQQDLQAVREAYDELHQEHAELSSRAKAQAQHIFELGVGNSSQRLSVSTQVFPPKEPISSSELSSSGSLQHLASSQTENPDGLEDTEAVTKLVATGTAGGQQTPNLHQQSFKQPLNPSNPFTCPLITNGLVSPCTHSGRADNDTNTLSKYIKNSKTSETDPDAVSDLSSTSSSGSDNKLVISSGTSLSSPDHRSVSGSVGLLSKEANEERNIGMNEKELGGKDDGGQERNNRKEEERNAEQQRNREEVQGEGVEEGGSSGEKRGALAAQTTDTADRREDSQGSAEDAGDTRNPDTETRDRAERHGTDGAGERGKKAAHTSEAPETQILGQTTTDWATKKSRTRQVVDFTESPEAAWGRLSQRGTERDADCGHVSAGWERGRGGRLLHTLGPDDCQGVNRGPDPVVQVQNLCLDEVQTRAAEPPAQLPSQIHQASEKTTEETPADNSAADFPAGLSEPLSQSSVCSSQTNVPLAAQTDGVGIIQDPDTTPAQTVPRNPRDVTDNMKLTDEMCGTRASEDCASAGTAFEPQPLRQGQEISEQDSGQLQSLVTNDDDDDGDSSARKKSEVQANADAREKYGGETVQGPVEKSDLKDVCVDITVDAVDLGSEAEPGRRQDQLKNDKTQDARDAKTPGSETDLKPSVHPAGPRSSFDLGSVLHQFVQGSEKNTSLSGGRLRPSPSTIPMIPSSKQSRVPLVITRASDLLNASSVSGSAASLKRHQPGEWKALGEADAVRHRTCYEESRASLSISSFPASTSSSTVSRLSWPTPPGCSRAPTSATGPTSECDWEPSCSQEREDQQSLFRAHISKIEQFLNTERLSLSKRRRTEN